jgi:hypothetical protein
MYPCIEKMLLFVFFDENMISDFASVEKLITRAKTAIENQDTELLNTTESFLAGLSSDEFEEFVIGSSEMLDDAFVPSQMIQIILNEI